MFMVAKKNWDGEASCNPTLETRFSFWISGLITGCIWAIWHLPLWFVIGVPKVGCLLYYSSLFTNLSQYSSSSCFKRLSRSLFCAIFHGLNITLLSLFVIKINLLFILG